MISIASTSSIVKPWTQHGTGCSLVGLMDQNQGSVELMISHSWTGSVTKTLSILESLPGLFFIPKETRVFICTMCLYQPEDYHQAGLTIEQQIEFQPISKIIENKPTYGMYVFIPPLLRCMNDYSAFLKLTNVLMQKLMY